MNGTGILTPEHAAELLQHQDELQSESSAVLHDLNLVSLLSQAGKPIQLGSSILGLMVWRDIDMNVSSPGLSIDRALEIMLPIYKHPKVKRIRYMNEVGLFNPTDEEIHDRYYFAIYYYPSADTEWKIDISFWVGNEQHPEPIHEAIARKLTPETRLAILWIKDIWYRLPTYRTEVYSVDIYEAVLEHGVRTPSEFDAYLIEQGKPGRQPR